ncbi:MAG TPA: hypothetical protein VHI13_16720 [Candidatus Kapabacteria bacterium]|nr:hypothetical protein [Candidatus Kapabacteria bacterium]
MIPMRTQHAVDRIIDIICEDYGCDRDMMLRSRQSDYVLLRALTVAVVRKRLWYLTKNSISEAFGHARASGWGLQTLEVIEARLAVEPGLRQELTRLLALIPDENSPINQ